MAATKKSASKQAAKPAKKTAAVKAGSRPAAKRPPAKQTTKKSAPPAKTSAAKSAPTKKSASTKKQASSSSGPSTARAEQAPAKKSVPQPVVQSEPVVDTVSGNGIPAPRGRTKDGIAYTKDFDVKFLKAQQDLLVTERRALSGQATRLEDEANSLIEEGEMGDVQFDDESGEGDTMVVERERDLALSAQARQTIADIDAALARMSEGSYGYSVASGRPIPRERLEALPWATVLVEEKVGGIGRR
ncbi:MAG: hypothetical protein ACRDZ2_12115 [Ilumatobacteraceae bacterium]